MDILAALFAMVGGAAVAGIAVFIVLRWFSRQATSGHEATVAAAVEQLALERDATLDALRAQLEVERLQLSAEREHMLQATIDTVLSVAGDKLGSHAERASDELRLRSESFEARVASMNHELRRVQDLVTQMQREKAEQHGQFVQGIDQALRASAALTDTAQSLREALSNSRARGQWGERMADDVLRVAGLAEGVNYLRQQTLDNGGRPDFTFMLPRSRVLHMDVKFPIDNYLKVLDAPTEAAQEAHTRAFVKDVRARVRELTRRDYIDPDATVGYVLLFIPNEAVYGFIHEHDPRLLDEALGQHVVLCSPCTLFAVLGVVRQAVDNFLVERTSDEILECLRGFSKQWQAFSDKLDRLGSQFGTAQRTYDELAGTRRRQLQKQLDHIERLRTTRGLDDGMDDRELVGANDDWIDDAHEGHEADDAVDVDADDVDAGRRRIGAAADHSFAIDSGTDADGDYDVVAAVGAAPSPSAGHPDGARQAPRLRPVRSG